ncbi:hypothetical protein [Bacteroidetes bacterium endosymbiont of Geopemphigus sp.]|uniref:hypothetical protein n=1 Tax=Bacteroidetes bacterium endosymbiont of Geopemphigus sp. TaxID=2047937 RepID=UPI003D2F5FAB
MLSNQHKKNYDISLTLKHTTDYEFDNIFLFVETFYQDKTIKKIPYNLSLLKWMVIGRVKA